LISQILLIILLLLVAVEAEVFVMVLVEELEDIELLQELLVVEQVQRVSYQYQ